MSDMPIAPSSEADSSYLPTPPRERIVVLDILRGFAIFGILIVNFEGYGFSTYYGTDIETQWPGFGDRLAEKIITLLAIGKFNVLFTFLFGLGFALQMERAERQGQSVLSRYTRRLLCLLCIGLFHKFLIWDGDILVTYAVMGFVLLLFRRAKPRTLLVCAALFYAVFFAPWEVNEIRAAISHRPAVAAQHQQEDHTASEERHRQEQEAIHIYAHGSFRQILALRASEALLGYRLGYNSLSHVLSLFLLGMYVGRKRIFKNLERHRGLFDRMFVWGYGVGFGCGIAMYFIYWPGLPVWVGLTRPMIFATAKIALAGAYTATLVKLWSTGRLRLLLDWFASIGKMALSNYILQSLVGTLIFYHFGLGLYARIGPLLGLGLSAAIFAGQVWLSKVWLKRAHYGPLEWVLRSVTYRRRQPVWISTPI
jgi:uncharacterized protein